MMKILTGEWLAAEAENRALRDSKREEFWASTGVEPISNPKDIDIAPDNRGDVVRRLADQTIGHTVQDPDLVAITLLGASQIAQFRLGSFTHVAVGFAPDITQLIPKALRATYFVTPEMTSVELSEPDSEV